MDSGSGGGLACGGGPEIFPYFQAIIRQIQSKSLALNHAEMSVFTSESSISTSDKSN